MVRAKTSPLSKDAPKERVTEWIDENLKRSRLDLLLAVEKCLEGDGEWKSLYKRFEKSMKLNLEMWWDVRKRERSTEIVRGLLQNIKQERRQLEQELSQLKADQPVQASNSIIPSI